MPSRWWPLVAICLGSFMLLLDVTIVTVALPDMAADLRASFTSLQWVLDVYALVLAALLLGAGSTADIVGRRRAYVAGLVLFALGSLACGLAPTATVLITARGLQGIGAALMFATTTALLNATYSGRDRGVAFGVWGATNGAGSALGPLVGGLLTQHAGWRWIFLVNLPVTVLTIALTLAVCVETRRPGVRLDVPGILAFTVFAGALTYGLIRAGDDGWTAAGTVAFLVLAAVAIAIFLGIERKVEHPLLELRLFRSASFSATITAGLVLMAAAFSMLAYISVWLQGVLGLSPVAAGVALLPMAVCSFLVSAIAGRALQGVSPRWTVGIGLVLVGVGSGLQSMVGAESGALALLPGLAVVGVGVGLAIPTLTAAALSAAPPQLGGMVAGTLNTARQLGYALGVAVLGLVFRNTVEGHVSDPGLVEAVVAGQAPGTGEVHAAVAAGLHAGSLLAGAAGVVGGLLVLLLVRPTARAHAPQTAVPIRA
ncbi:MFS transporter [Pseudonocardia kujensis]|uniref:MFS transporter n=1 Tax=Pseudonocardia kujensis TaxID=1128675 RepID=UPI001E56F0C4|nr:MFS transporter [Pseudonocardia kujensis]MCE0765494.1 MFS transporter [Pseudonocardia kujensis]